MKHSFPVGSMLIVCAICMYSIGLGSHYFIKSQNKTVVDVPNFKVLAHSIKSFLSTAIFLF